MSGVGTGIAIAAGVGAAGSVAGGLIGAHGAGKAAETQASAAENVASMQKQLGEEQLQYQGALSNAELTNMQPWYKSSEGALSLLDGAMGITPGPNAQSVQMPSLGIGANGKATGAAPIYNTPSQNPTGNSTHYGGVIFPNQEGHDFQGGRPVLANGAPAGTAAGATSSTPATGWNAAGTTQTQNALNAPLLKGWDQTFTSPTAVTEQNDPGYKFRLEQGTKAMDMSAAARGNLLTGGTANAEQQFGQDFGSNEYQNVYNRALTNYSTNYNTYASDTANRYNRLAAMAGINQVSPAMINSPLSNAGTAAQYIMTNTGNQVGQQLNNAAAATASGYVGQANAYSNMFAGLGNNAMNALMLKQLQGGGGSTTPAYDGSNGYS